MGRGLAYFSSHSWTFQVTLESFCLLRLELRDAVGDRHRLDIVERAYDVQVLGHVLHDSIEDLNALARRDRREIGVDEPVELALW